MGNHYIGLSPFSAEWGPESITETLVAFIGDSITVGFGLVSVLPPPEQAANGITAANPGTSYAAQNVGVNGASTADWVSTGGGTPLADALIFITRYGITHVSVMLGTNDANLDSRNATDYQTNLQSTIDTLVLNGVTDIVINQSPYIKTENVAGANALLVTYHTANSNLVTANPGVVRLGDTTAYSVFQTNQASYYQSDGLHPNDTGATALAALWAASF